MKFEEMYGGMNLQELEEKLQNITFQLELSFSNLVEEIYRGNQKGIMILFMDKAKAEKLGNILSFLDSLIFTMLECPEIIVSNLISKLRDYNCVGEEVIEKYASLQTGMLRAFMDKRVTLNTKQFVALVATLFLLDNTLNRETPFPWE